MAHLPFNHAGGNIAAMVDGGFVSIGDFSGVRDGDEVGEGLERQFADLVFQAEREGAVDGRHAENGFRFERGIGGGEFAHFVEKIEFQKLFARAVEARETVCAEADVDPRRRKFSERKPAMLEITVAARTMANIHFSLGEQRDILRREIIHMHREQVPAEQSLAFQMLHRRTEAAIGHVAAIAGEPGEKLAAAVHEHFKLLRRFGNMHRERQAVAAGGMGGEAQQSGRGGVGGVRRKPHTAAAAGEGGDFVEGFTDDFARRTAAFHTGHFQEGKNTQRRRGPGVGQQFGDHFYIAHRGGAGAEEHLGAVQPGLGEVGINPAGLAGGDQLDPVNEIAGRRKLPGHRGVIQVAMGIDEAGQQDLFTQIHDLRAFGNYRVRPAAHGNDAIARKDDRAILDHRPGDRQHHPRAENGGGSFRSGLFLGLRGM